MVAVGRDRVVLLWCPSSVKAQQFQREIVETIGRVPQVMENVAALREMRADGVGVAATGEDARLTTASLMPDVNPALDEWRRAA